MRPFLVVNAMLVAWAMAEFFLTGCSIELFWARLDSIRWPEDYEWE